MSAPVAELAWNATSGTPRIVPLNELPAGSAFWYDGLANTWLKPPPENVQATSAKVPPGLKGPLLRHLAPTFGNAKFVRGCEAVANGSVQRYVPPIPVTSGSEAGTPTVGKGVTERTRQTETSPAL